MHRSFIAIFSIVAVAIHAGCSHETPASANVTTTSAALDARSTLAQGGEFHFVLDESPEILASIQARCAKQADAAACVERIREAGAAEGWRIVAIDDTHVQMQSFGSEDGNEEIFLQAPVVLEPAVGNFVTVRATAAPTGTRVPPPEKLAQGLRIEVVDANTLVFEDGPRGTLSFRRTR